ncbi:hypothetical protein RRG08_027980 [Elysia crispata]|uniref:Uncharacterized protein n=1 Tax=Elysia crispata TaxID=231223 RepID=A0AAE1BBH0_9GAST|nr:hypothetical protein RRG08_027980 [Elysia crispata]
MVSQPNDVTVPAVDAAVYKLSSYHLPSSPPRRFASRDWTPEATGRTPRMKNQLAASQVGTFPRSYRKDTSNGKPTSLLRE